MSYKMNDYYLKPIDLKRVVEIRELITNTKNGDPSEYGKNENVPCYNCGKQTATSSCKRCGVKYCDRQCQCSDWRRHKNSCMSKSLVSRELEAVKKIDTPAATTRIITSSSGKQYMLYFNITPGPVPRGCFLANSELGFLILMDFFTILPGDAKEKGAKLVEIILSKTINILVPLDYYHNFYFQLTEEQRENTTNVVI